MKKLMLFASALAGLFLAASCQQENLEPVGKGNTVTFTVEAPAALQTKAIADGMNVDEVIYEVWINSGANKTLTQKLYQSSTPMFKEDGKNKATVTLDLVNDQSYTVLFWAQVAEADAYNTTELTSVKYAKPLAEYKANDESLAAFYAVSYIDETTSANQTVYLTRPFAQINLCTLNSKAAAQVPGDYNIAIVNSKMTLKQVPTEFNVATGDVDEYVDFEFTYAPVPADPSTITVNGKEYYYAGMNYVFAGDNLELTYDIQTSLNGSTNYAVVNNVISSVPVRENYRTNIVGNLLTSKTDYEIIVDADFNTPETVLGDEWSQTGDYKYVVNQGASATVLAEVLAHADAAAKAAATKAAGPAVTIDLAGDVVWETGAGIGSTPLLPADSPISAVVINGNGKTFTATGNGVGAVCLANGALLTFNNVKVVDKSVSYAENSWEYGYLEFAGNLAFNGCQFVNAAMMEGTTAAFVDCTFNSFDDNQYAVWVSDGVATFEGCTFAGARGLKVHEAYGSEVVSVVVDGCLFDQLTKKPGIALGDLNAETSVTIQNSTFDRCQAGDQGLYIYETDTDVTTFTFVCQNNFVVPVGDEPYVQEDGTIAVATTKALETALATATAGDEITLAPGTYKMTAYKAGVKIAGADKESVIVDIKGAKFGVNGDVNIENVTLQFADANYTGFQHSTTEAYTNCIIEGQPFLYGENVTYNSCTFVQTSSDLYNVWTYGAKNVTFNDCTFNSAGKSVLVYAEKGAVQNVTLNNCVLNASVPVAGKAAVEIDSSFPNGGTGKYTVALNNTVANGFAEGSVSKSTLWNVKKGEANCDVLVDGKKMLAAGVAAEGEAYLLLDAKGLFWFADQVNVAKNAFSGKTVKLAANIDLANAAWTPVGQTGATTFNGVFDGQNYTISNLNVNSEAQTGAHYSSGLFGWVETHADGNGQLKNVKIEGATVVGHHNCGALVGYITEKYAVVDNCHVSNAAITCTYANGDADGDKAGALIGNATNATKVNNCSAANSTVSAGRDSGQLIGAAAAANVTGCSATDVTVTDNGTGTGKNIRNEVIGRLL